MKKTIWSRIGIDVDKRVRRISRALGISISEYVRRLILQDLDSRKMFDNELREAIQEHEVDEPTIRKNSHNPREAILRLLDDN
jgi:hypothetical protein